MHLLSSNRHSNLSLFQLMFEKKANPNIKNKKGFTAFQMALKYHSDIKVIQYLYHNSSHPHSLTQNKETPLHLACSNLNFSLPLLSFLLEQNCDLQKVDINGNSVLHTLIFNENHKSTHLKFLINQKSNLNLTNNSNHSPCHLITNKTILNRILILEITYSVLFFFFFCGKMFYFWLILFTFC